MDSNQSPQSGPMYFERQYNLVYILSNSEDEQEKAGAGSSLGKKNTATSKSASNYYQNILIYDVPKEMQIWLFKTGELADKEYVANLVFEVYYNQEHHNMEFAMHTGNIVANNFNLEARPVSDKLLICTAIENEAGTRLWISDKWGFEKRVLATLSEDAFCQLDVYNSVVRVFEKEKNGQFKIQSFDY